MPAACVVAHRMTRGPVSAGPRPMPGRTRPDGADTRAPMCLTLRPSGGSVLRMTSTDTGFQRDSEAGGRIAGHHITWHVWASDAVGGNRTKLRHVATMRGHWLGWDATCECGWTSNTGGATKASVQRDVWDHKLDVHLAMQEA